MNLATRCPSCGTVFRVGEDQLQSSEGWVRCGRCHGVFNATEVLFDIDTDAPMRLAGTGLGDPVPEPAPPASEPGALPPSVVPAGSALRAPQPEPLPPSPEDAPFEALLRAPSRGHEDALPGRPERSDEADDPDEQDEPIVITDHVPTAATMAPASMPARDGPTPLPDGPPQRDDAPMVVRPPSEPALAEVASGPALAAGAALAPAALPAQPTPSFLRQAERGRLARHPAARAAAVAGVVLLALAVPVQMGLLWRDSLAAHVPRSLPVLQALCQLAGCTVQPLRRIHALAVSSSGLNRLEGSPLYRLQLVLHNRADTAVMAPAVDLTLTDPQGQLVARRVLDAAELGLPQPALQAGQELPIKLLLSTGERRVAGYTLELFYP